MRQLHAALLTKSNFSPIFTTKFVAFSLFGTPFTPMCSPNTDIDFNYSLQRLFPQAILMRMR